MKEKDKRPLTHGTDQELEGEYKALVPQQRPNGSASNPHFTIFVC